MARPRGIYRRQGIECRRVTRGRALDQQVDACSYRMSVDRSLEHEYYAVLREGHRDDNLELVPHRIAHSLELSLERSVAGNKSLLGASNPACTACMT